MVRRAVMASILIVCGSLAAITILDGSPSIAQQEEEAVAVRIVLAEGEIPTDDPMAAMWDQVTPAEFKLAPQVHWPDRLLDATVKSVSIRAVHNGDSVAILLEYQDPTEDAADAAALEFMVGDKKAHFAHGQHMHRVEGGPVNIWYWKNESGKAVDMSAKGFGTLRPQEQQDVQAKGVRQDDRWRVVFSRSLETSDKEQDVQIVPGQWASVAFAVWDGKLTGTGEPKEKGSQKAVSSWWYIRAEPPPDRSVFLYALVGVAVMVGFQAALVRKIRRGRS